MTRSIACAWLCGAAGVLSPLSGCRSCGDGDVMSEDLASYMDFCSEVAVQGRPGEECADDWMVGAGLTSWERNSSFKVVYADADYLSIRAEEYAYSGGAHGGTKITVASFCRKSGRRVRLEDVVSAEKMPSLTRALREAVLRKIGGEEHLQGEVKPTENFYVAKDGLHFVYNEYEVACYAEGWTEVCIGVKAL